jgi:transposase-like protein
MAGPDLVNLPALIDDAKCFALVRQHRWPEGVRCSFCASPAVTRDGCDETQPCRQRYRCKQCARRFDDLTGTVLAGHHQPLCVWVLCLYFMGLNLSNRQIARELELSVPDVQIMTDQLRHGLVVKTPAVQLEGEVEIDEVYVVAGHKGQPAAVTKGASWTPSPAGRCAGPRHAGEGQAAHPWCDPARGPGDAAHAGQCAAGHDSAGY